jgi:REP element-mobilizing transposase RayT
VARRLRIQYPGAIYHVINRGNYRRDVFETTGAASSFEATLGEASTRFGWEVHAFSILRNHFHLALTTPIPNLGDGMHWLQTTFAVRFNRFRAERGHLFQGRYQSPLVENVAALLRVVDYIHLNPVRAGIVPPEQVAQFRWSSLARFVGGPRPGWLSAGPWLNELRLEDSAQGWTHYIGQLISLASDPVEQEKRGFDEISRGRAVGTQAWKQAVAREQRQRALELDLPRDEIRDLKEARWQVVLDEVLSQRGKNRDDLVQTRRSPRWKVEMAFILRKQVGAPYRWIAEKLQMGSPLSARVAVCRFVNM